MSALTVIMMLLALKFIPDLAGHTGARSTIRTTLRVTGVLVILLAVFAWLFAHNVLYTYIASFLGGGTTEIRPDVALLVFGIASFVGIWLTGALIDRTPRGTALIGSLVMIASAIVLNIASESAPVMFIGLTLWGVAFGGAATQLQTAMGNAAGPHAGMAIAVLTAVFNLAVFAAAAGGTFILEGLSSGALPLAMVIASIITSGAVLLGHTSAFPVRR